MATQFEIQAADVDGKTWGVVRRRAIRAATDHAQPAT
jgi:hypothetical protein